MKTNPNANIPVVAGVLDGDKVTLPPAADEGYKARLQNGTQTSDYVLRIDGDARAFVAEGARWPILSGASA